MKPLGIDRDSSYDQSRSSTLCDSGFALWGGSRPIRSEINNVLLFLGSLGATRRATRTRANSSLRSSPKRYYRVVTATQNFLLNNNDNNSTTTTSASKSSRLSSGSDEFLRCVRCFQSIIMPPATVSIHDYRAALALNNMAVVLIQKGTFREAMHTLRDSLTLLQRAFQPSSPEASRGQRRSTATSCRRRRRRKEPQDTTTKTKYPKKNDDNDNNKCLFEAACQRYSKVLLPQGTSSASNKNTDHQDALEVTVVEDNELFSLLSAAMYGPSSTLWFPIRITSFSATCGTHNNDMLLLDPLEVTKQFGILLYNHGLATLLVAQTTPPTTLKSAACSKSTKQYIRKSHKSLRMAQTCLVSSLTTSTTTTLLATNQHGPLAGSASKSLDSFMDQNQDDGSVLLVTALTLNVQSLILESRHQSNKVQDAQRIVSNLCASVDQQLEFFQTTTTTTTARTRALGSPAPAA